MGIDKQNNILKISFKYLYLCTSLEIGKGVWKYR